MKDEYSDIDEFLEDWKAERYPQVFDGLKADVAKLDSSRVGDPSVDDDRVPIAMSAAVRVASEMLRDYSMLMARS